jgi:hypothetical protein
MLGEIQKGALELGIMCAELRGKVAALESEVKWQREVLAVLMSKMTQGQYVLPSMDMEQWGELMRRGSTWGGIEK